MIRSLAIVAVLVAVLGLGRSLAAAEVVEVPATPVARFGNTSASTCDAIYFLQFKDVTGGTAWRAEWKYNGFPKSKTSAPPFDDRIHAGRGWVAPAGTHWIQTNSSSRVHFGGAPVDCSDLPGVVLPATTDAKVLVARRPNAKIVGKVVDRGGDPVKGVRVRAKGAGADRTDAAGEYEIDVPERRRKYVVTPFLRKTTFAPRRRSVTVRPGKATRANNRANLERFEVSGTVTTTDCDPAAASCRETPRPGVPITARGTTSGSTVTDEAGQYTMKLRRGTYRIAARGDYNSVLTQPIGVRRDREDVDFVGCEAAASANANAFSQHQVAAKPACKYELTGILRNSDRKLVKYYGEVLISGEALDGTRIRRRLRARQGRFRDTLPQGDYEVTVSTPGDFTQPSFEFRHDRNRTVFFRSFRACKVVSGSRRAGGPVTHLGSHKDDRIVVANARTRVVVHSGDGDDTVIATGPVLVCASNGKNRITTGFGDDFVLGGDDAEVISTGPGDDVVLAGGGDDRISGGIDEDEIFGGAGADTIRGGTGADTLKGGLGRDALYGWFGDDDLDVGRGGNVALVGGPGVDVCTGRASIKRGCP